jgi:hypothetical protein
LGSLCFVMKAPVVGSFGKMLAERASGGF